MTAIALQFGYYGATSWLPSYLVKDLGVNLQNTGWYVAATYTMAFVGKVVTGYLADIAGRRAAWIAAGVLTAVYLPVLIYAANRANIAWLLLISDPFHSGEDVRPERDRNLNGPPLSFTA